MIHKLSASIASRWVERGIVQAEDVENYIFGLQLVLSGLINFAVPIGLSICLGVPAAWIPFMLSFVLLRMTAGGVHAKTQWQCILIFCSVYGVSLFLARQLENSVQFMGLLSIAIFCMVVVLLISPVPATNKPLTAHQSKRNRTISVFLAGAFLLPAFFMKKASFSYTFYVVQFYLGELSAVLSLIWAKVQGRTAG